MQQTYEMVEKQQRFSTRIKRQPIWLNDFVYYTSINSHSNEYEKLPVITHSPKRQGTAIVGCHRR